jgi:hypothetical protein
MGPNPGYGLREVKGVGDVISISLGDAALEIAVAEGLR